MMIFWLMVLSLFSNADCTFSDQPSIEDGQSAHLFKYEFAPEGKDCIGIDRNCVGGELDGDPAYIYAFCSQEKQCEHPFDDVKLKPDESIEAYETPKFPCKKEIRVCDGKTGKLSGSFNFGTCIKKRRK